MSRKLKPIPRFRTEAEERKFWETHDSTDYVDWSKAKRVTARLPFAEDLLSAYYCAFDRTTPIQVKAALLGALAYFVLPVDLIPDILPVLGYADDAAVLATAAIGANAIIGQR